MELLNGSLVKEVGNLNIGEYAKNKSVSSLPEAEPMQLSQKLLVWGVLLKQKF